jgi:hypothetical protein
MFSADRWSHVRSPEKSHRLENEFFNRIGRNLLSVSRERASQIDDVIHCVVQGAARALSERPRRCLCRSFRLTSTLGQQVFTPRFVDVSLEHAVTRLVRRRETAKQFEFFHENLDRHALGHVCRLR